MTTRGLLSWNTGHGWSLWHVPRAGETRTRCGIAIPPSPPARHSYSADAGARVTPETICHTCVLHVRPEDLPPEEAPRA